MILTENLTLDQVYNADETGLCWRAIPTKTLAEPNELKVEGFKAEKERVTLMACANASGTHKLDLVFIYKYQNPRSLKHIDKDKLPVVYYSQTNAWMTTVLFERWFEQEFVPVVKGHLNLLGLEERAVLLLDNAPSHTKVYLLMNNDSKIRCVFLPPNTTSVLQPMDQGVLDTVKRHYRKKLMRKALDEDNESKSMAEIKKSITIKDAIRWSAEAWEDIAPYTLRSSWNMVLPPSIDKPEVVEQEATSDGLEDENAMVSQWILESEEDFGNTEMNDNELIQFVLDEKPPQEEPDEELVPTPDIIPISDAGNLLKTILPTLENETRSTKEEIKVIQNIVSRWTLQHSSN